MEFELRQGVEGLQSPGKYGGTIMLVLSRKLGESIAIGDDITFTVTDICGSRVKIAIDAPADVLILREELKRKTQREEDQTVKG